MSLWDTISASARNLGDFAANKAIITKLRTEIVLIDRSIDARKRAFGVAMYDYLSPLSQSQNFYAASDKLTTMVRPLLINAQKEIEALVAKRVKQKEELAKAEVNRASAFPNKAESVGQKLINFGKAGYLHGGETKIKTELSVNDRLIKGHKEDFGVALFDAFAKAEDEEGFLPTDRQIRNVYDTARGDVDKLHKQKKAKEEEMGSTGGKNISENNNVIAVETTTSTVASANPNTISYGTSGGTQLFRTTAGTPITSETKGTVSVLNNDSFSSNLTGYTNPSMSSQEQQKSLDLLDF